MEQKVVHLLVLLPLLDRFPEVLLRKTTPLLEGCFLVVETQLREEVPKELPYDVRVQRLQRRVVELVLQQELLRGELKQQRNRTANLPEGLQRTQRHRLVVVVENNPNQVLRGNHLSLLVLHQRNQKRKRMQQQLRLNLRRICTHV